MEETVKRESLYSKKENLLPGKNKITYSTDVRDFNQVARSIPCQHACPAITNIPGYIQCINEKRYGRAYELNRKANILPGVLGRICSRPCEAACRHSEPDNGESVSICHLKRSCADLKSPLHRIIEGNADHIKLTLPCFFLLILPQGLICLFFSVLVILHMPLVSYYGRRVF